ncbi:PREDICTED: U-box domain-containing protein 10-like [Tarenaya hassleriana]|uniref:U-box domain-containing protein 10-like n=1 Tax=Tarenaya hassleriana TaxID=28532 RepID=UPI0008FD7349|nr:PREDICTED: U-box domain-containing protein 10-like [Tarenaya hassleriana]
MEVQDHVAGAIRNVAAVEDIRTTLAEEGAVPVLLRLLVSGSTSAAEKATSFIAILSSSGEFFLDLIVKERGLQTLMHLVQDSSDSDTIEQALLALSQLSIMDSVSRVLSSSTGFIIQLGEFIKHGNTISQQIFASLLANLTISDDNKRAIVGCSGSLIRMIESPKPAGLQDAAAAAVSLLAIRSNRKDLFRDEKSVMRLVQMLDPRSETMADKELPVMVTAAALSGGGGHMARKKLIAAGADRYLQRLSEMEVPGAKKALQRLTGNRLRSIFSRAWKE